MRFKRALEIFATILAIAYIFTLSMLVNSAHGDVIQARAGVTIKLTSGVVYDSITGLLPPYFALPAGCNIVGRDDPSQGYPIIRIPSSPEGYAFKFTHNGARLSGVRIEGGGVFVEGPGGISDSALIDDVDFQHKHTRGTNADALEFSAIMRKTRVTRCNFAGDGFGLITNKGYEDATIANNWFDQSDAGLHIDSNWPGSKNLLIEQNLFRGMIGMGVELQGTGENITVQDNWYELPRYIFSSNKMAYSLILDKSKRIRTLRNVHISETRPQQPVAFVRDVFEAGGDDHLISDCFSDGGNCIVAGNDGVGGCSITVDGNRFKNFWEPARLSFPATGRSLTVLRTSDTQRLSDLMEDRIAKGLRPQRFSRYGSVVTIPTTPPTPPAAPTTNLADYNALKANYDTLKAWADKRP